MEPRVISGGLACDDRGSVRFVNDLDFAAAGIKRMYQVENNPLCEIRAWHGHMKEEKYVYVARGSAIIAARTMDVVDGRPMRLGDQRDAKRFVLSALQPKILHIPAGLANGFRMLEPGTIIIFYSTLSLAESAADDYRFNFSEQTNLFDIEVR
jgi:dTDP-4-dehydrorhamnose 3,5-epimerase